MNRGASSQKPIMRWHQRLGLTAALLVLLLCITGIMLNHTQELDLAGKPVKNQWLLSQYGIKEADIQSYRAADTWVSQVGGHHLFLNSEQVSNCASAIKGAAILGDLVIVACHEQLILLSREGDVIERLDAVQGLPLPIVAIAEDKGRLLLKTKSQQFIADLNLLKFESVAVAPQAWSQLAEAPQKLREDLLRKYSGSEIHWERVVLDLHSGRILGTVGVWIMDLAALVFMLLALSGFWSWWVRKREGNT